MKQSYIYPIHYQDVDADRYLRLYTLENHILTTAGLSADELGCGIHQLLGYNYTWVLAHLNMELKYLPVHSDVIRIETWIESNSHCLSARNFRIWLEQSSRGRETGLIGEVKSVWTVLDLGKREIVNAFEMPMFRDVVDGEVLTMPRAARITPIDTPTHEGTHTVVYSDMDYNGHCNSCKYLEMMLNTRFPEFIRKGRSEGEETPIRVDINYQKEVGLGEQMHILCRETEDDIMYQEKTESGATSCTCRIAKI